MSLPAATVWEVRPTVGADTNGGGFVTGASGTDYSQQNSKNSGGNNQSTTDAVGVGTTTLTSATASFTSAIVGNIIYLTGTGVTTGWYEVTAFTNSTTVTLDRSPGTFTGATMNIGGALATVSQAYTNSVGSNTIYVKASGSYTVTTTLTLSSSVNNSAGPYKIIGYTTTRGDGGRFTWTTATNSTFLIQPGSGNPYNYSFQNIAFTNTAGTKVAAVDGSVSSQALNLAFTNCTFLSAAPSAINGDYVGGVHFNIIFLFLINCEIANTTSHGLRCSGNTLLFGCYIHGCGGSGILSGSNSGSGLASQGPLVLNRTVIYNNTSDGIQFATTQGITSNEFEWLEIHNSAITTNGADGINFDSNSAELPTIFMQNTIVDSNGGYGINNASSQCGLLQFYNNAWYNNTSGNAHGTGFAIGTNDVILTASPYTSPSTDDFTLNSTSGGGAACKAAGYQGALNGALNSGQAIDIGPVQTAGGGGSVTNYVVSKNITTVIVEEGL